MKHRDSTSKIREQDGNEHAIGRIVGFQRGYKDHVMGHKTKRLVGIHEVVQLEPFEEIGYEELGSIRRAIVAQPTSVQLKQMSQD